MTRRILITGCSGGGKSTLLAALAAAGFATVMEPGRRIVAAELAAGGHALPWVDERAFAHKALALARADLEQATGDLVFFDRGLIDAAVALRHLDGTPLTDSLGGSSSYDDPVFFTPPWPGIFETDPDRRHGLSDAIAECMRLERGLSDLGHRVLTLPQDSVDIRRDFVLAALS